MFLDLSSSSKKGETRTAGCHTRAVIKVQLHSEAKQINVSGKLRIEIYFHVTCHFFLEVDLLVVPDIQYIWVQMVLHFVVRCKVLESFVFLVIVIL